MPFDRTLRSITLICAVLFIGTPAWAGVYADTVNEFIPGDPDLADVDGCALLLPTCDALGPPDGNYVSLGEQGSITLSFSGHTVVDGPGSDLTVYGTGNAGNEPGTVYVSSDGITFVQLGEFTTGVSMGFDLAAVGLASATLIRIDDQPGGTGLPTGLALDVDAVEAIHVGDGPPQMQGFADTVNEFVPGGFDLTDVSGCGELLPSCHALGPNNGAFVSLGELGSITLSFSGRVVIDGPGNDLIVWSTTNAPAEPGRIFASSDGVTFLPLGDYTVAVNNVGFDLANAGLTSAAVIRIDDLEGGTWPPGFAFDVDALQALYLDGAVQVSNSTWGWLKAIYR